jgi:polar amino acid transport system permease protein
VEHESTAELNQQANGADQPYRPSSQQQERERYRRSRKRRNTWIAALCTLAVLVVVGAAVVASPGWARVHSTFLDGAEFRKTFPAILRGFWLNIQMFLISEVLILVLGLLIALARVTRAPGLQPLRLAATLYVDVFRGVPTLLLIFLIGYGVPALALQGTPSQPWVLGAIALVLSYAAYVAEVFRAGLNSVHPAQRNAARALGLSEPQTLRRCATWSRRCSTTSSRCRRTPRWWPSSARWRRCGWRRSTRTTTSTTPPTWARRRCSSP